MYVREINKMCVRVCVWCAKIFHKKILKKYVKKKIRISYYIIYLIECIYQDRYFNITSRK